MPLSNTAFAIGIGVAVITILLTSIVYRIGDRNYTRLKERADSLVPFSPLLDWYLRLSTLGFGVAAVCFDHWLFFRFHSSLVFFYGGLTVIVLAEACFVWSMVALGGQYSACYDARIPTAIVRRGPYRWVRHPIYISNLILIGGATLASGTGWLLVNLALLARGCVLSARKEEAILAERFSDYRAYQRSTGMFLPRLF